MLTKSCLFSYVESLYMNGKDFFDSIVIDMFSIFIMKA